MQSSWLTEHVCDRLDKLNRGFLWSDDINKRKLHLVGWQKATLPKEKGGLGLRTTRLNNEALLAKLAWKILRKEETIWQSLVEAKYLKNGSLLHHQAKPGDSATWKGITRCVDILKPFLRWRIGNGTSILLWHDNWLGNGPLRDQGVHIIPA